MRGQVSVEHLLIIAFVLLILVPGVYFLFTYSQHSSASISAAQYAKLGQEMLDTAAQARSQGSNSWLTLEANLPAGIEDIVVAAGGTEIVISYMTSAGRSEAVFFAETPLSAKNQEKRDGSIFKTAPHPGKASFRFMAGPGDLVIIEER